MRIVSVQDGFERGFWRFVNKNPLDYYFFIFDWKNRRDQTKILLALEDSQIGGLMLLYADQIIQLRGNQKAVASLLDAVELEHVELQAPVDCEDIVLKKYRPEFKHIVVMMRLKKGEANIQIKHTPVRLSIEDAEDVAEVMRKADPIVWSALSAAARHWQDAYMLGIKHENKLVSVGLTRFVDFGSNISAMATTKEYRNMGFATSIVSALVQEIMKNSSMALIHVLKDNVPAVRVYTKVGFKPYKEYFLMRGKRIDK